MKFEVLVAFVTVDPASLDNVCRLAVDVHIGLRFLALAGLDKFGGNAQLLQVSLLLLRIQLQLLQEG